MLDSLRFVASSVARKDYVPALTHFKIENGQVTGFNGVISLSSDIDVDLNIYPNASKLISAVNACSETIALSVTPAGRLAVVSGKFKAFVDCLPEVPDVFVEPEGEQVELGPNFLQGLKTLAPVMGVDASRPWAMGVKLQAQSMLATNNVMIAEYWHGTHIPIDVVLPAVAVEELIRVNENPKSVQVTENSISFWFSDRRWLRSSLIDAREWPLDRFYEILNRSLSDQTDFPEGFFDSVDKLKPFLNEHNSIYFTADSISTSQHPDEGSNIEVSLAGVTEMQAYSFQQLRILGKIAKTINWSNYPDPCMFTGERLRGVLVGQRVG